jgi:hypothetical protein
VRCFKVIVWPDPPQADTVQGYIETKDEAAVRVILPKLDGLMLFDQSEKMCVEGCGDDVNHGPESKYSPSVSKGARKVRI